MIKTVTDLDINPHLDSDLDDVIEALRKLRRLCLNNGRIRMTEQHVVHAVVFTSDFDAMIGYLSDAKSLDLLGLIQTVLNFDSDVLDSDQIQWIRLTREGEYIVFDCSAEPLERPEWYARECDPDDTDVEEDEEE